MEEKKLTDEEIKKVFFVLKHGSDEGFIEYVKSGLVRENEYNRQKAEIERLKAEKNDWKQRYDSESQKYADLCNASSECTAKKNDRIAELQKQVDELKVENRKLFEYGASKIVECEQAVKNTAKEILDELETVKQYAKDFYGLAEKVGVDIAINVVKKILRQKGVEVE